MEGAVFSPPESMFSQAFEKCAAQPQIGLSFALYHPAQTNHFVYLLFVYGRVFLYNTGLPGIPYVAQVGLNLENLSSLASKIDYSTYYAQQQSILLKKNFLSFTILNLLQTRLPLPFRCLVFSLFYILCVCASMHTCKSEDNWLELVLCFQPVHSRAQT